MKKGNSTGIIICTRGSGITRKDVEGLIGTIADSITESIPCANKEHEGCGGYGCECSCHGKKQ